MQIPFVVHFDVEILFSSAGKVKKIKLYVDGEGRNKGDALVTYTSSESATIAAVKVCRHFVFISKILITIEYI